MFGIILNLSLLSLLTILNVEGAAIRDGNEPTPIILWHGLGGYASKPFLNKLKDDLTTTLPGVYIISIVIGNSTIEEQLNSYFMHPNTQIEIVCDLVKNDSKLSNGFNAIGFSQSSQFLRGLVQKCPEARVRNLITIAGQHQGVYGIPRCLGITSEVCDNVRRLLNHLAYDNEFQKFLTPATYWHDPLHEIQYKAHSTFIAEINNEIVINQNYIERLQSLENFVMVRNENDTYVQPIESSWFGFYKPGQAEEVLSLQETALYIQVVGLLQGNIFCEGSHLIHRVVEEIWKNYTRTGHLYRYQGVIILFRIDWVCVKWMRILS